MTFKQPLQPIYTDRNKIVRFRANELVKELVKRAGDLNSIASIPASNEDRAQVWAMLGYSVDGWAELSFVSRARIMEADEKVKQHLGKA